jgi:hypothetical protein
MATQTIQQQVTQIMPGESKLTRKNLRNCLAKVGNMLEAHQQSKLAYLEETYGKAWWKNIR